MAALPPKGDAISVVDSDAVSPGELPLELITSIARRNPEISEAKRDIERLELPLHDAPQAARHSPRKMCVARAKEINGVSSPNDWVTPAHYILHRNCVVIVHVARGSVGQTAIASPVGVCRNCVVVQLICGRSSIPWWAAHGPAGLGTWSIGFFRRCPCGERVVGGARRCRPGSPRRPCRPWSHPATGRVGASAEAKTRPRQRRPGASGAVKRATTASISMPAFLVHRA